MSYVIALVIIVVAAGALLLFRQPAEAPAEPVTESTLTQEIQEQTTPIEPETTTADAELQGSEAVSAKAEIETEETDAAPEEEPVKPATVSSSYEAEASYLTPKRTEHDILVMLEVEGDTIVDANITYDGGTAATPSHTAFDNAYGPAVIGQNINTVSLSRVGGASLTSDAFNEAVAEIRSERS